MLKGAASPLDVEAAGDLEGAALLGPQEDKKREFASPLSFVDGLWGRAEMRAPAVAAFLRQSGLTPRQLFLLYFGIVHVLLLRCEFF